jgi:hypothetical protein
MSDLAARLEALLRLYSAASERGELGDSKLGKQFRKDLQLLVSEHGADAVDAALEHMPDEQWPSVSLH